MARKKRQQAEIEQAKNRILKAAARLFAKQGYRASSMSEIAKEAGYTAPTLYTYFKGKAEIFHDLGTLVIDTLIAIYDEHSPSGLSVEQSLELLVMRQLKKIDELSDAFAFFLTIASLGDSPADKRSRKKHLAKVVSLRTKSIEWLEASFAGSEYESLDINTAEVFTSSVIKGFANRWAEDGRKTPIVDQTRLVTQLIIGGLREIATPV